MFVALYNAMWALKRVLLTFRWACAPPSDFVQRKILMSKSGIEPEILHFYQPPDCAEVAGLGSTLGAARLSNLMK